MNTGTILYGGPQRGHTAPFGRSCFVKQVKTGFKHKGIITKFIKIHNNTKSTQTGRERV